MAIGTEVVARRYENVSADTPISVDIPAFEASDVYVYFGKNSVEAVQGSDYAVELAGDFNTFTVTPTAALIDKIDALIAADDTEVDFIIVRRALDFKTETTPAGVRHTPFTSTEFDRNTMRDQQLNDRTDRAVRLGERFTAPYPDVTISEVPDDLTQDYLTVFKEGGGIGYGDPIRALYDTVAAAEASAGTAAAAAEASADTALDAAGAASISAAKIPPRPSDFDIVGDVLIPTHFADMQTAFDTFGAFPNEAIDVRIEAGHALTAGLKLKHGDYSRYTISADDATVYLDAAFVGVDGTDLVEGTTDDLFVFESCEAPVLSCLIDMEENHGCGMTTGFGSVVVMPGSCGVINAGRLGLLVRSGEFYGRGTIWNGAFQNAIKITSGSNSDIGGCYANDAWRDTSGSALDGAVHISRASNALAQTITINDSGKTGLSCRRSHCAAEGAEILRSATRGADARDGGTINVNGGEVTGSGDQDLRIATQNGVIYANGATYGTTSSPINSLTANGVIYDSAKHTMSKAEGFYTESWEMADDTAQSFLVPGTGGGRGLMLAVSCGAATFAGIVWARVTNPNASVIAAGISLAATTGILTGTTGVDGKITISPAVDGKIYVENRAGSTQTVTITVLSQAPIS